MGNIFMKKKPVWKQPEPKKPKFKVDDYAWADGVLTKGKVIIETVEANVHGDHYYEVRKAVSVSIRPTLMREEELLPYNEALEILYGP